MASPRSNKPTMLADILHSIQVHTQDGNNVEARALIYEAVAVATLDGYRAGIRPSPVQRTHTLAYIDLPAGQVAWEIAPHHQPNDGLDYASSSHHSRLQTYLDSFTPCPTTVYHRDGVPNGQASTAERRPQEAPGGPGA